MVRISRFPLDQMIAHAKREAPYEGCGLLAGEGSLVTAFYEIKNLPGNDPRIIELKIPEDRTVRYMMDPAEQFQAIRSMRARGLAMMGIYHSHPHSPAIPSATDIRLAFYPEVFYLIVSLEKRSPDFRAFFIVDKKVTEEKIEII